jgi:hypothetical protein
MKPGTNDEALLYVSAGMNEVIVFSLESLQQVGELTGMQDPWGECVDARGDIFITEASSSEAVEEYAHGGTSPIRTLHAFYGNGAPVGCAVSRNGDLAVSTDFTLDDATDGIARTTSDEGGILIFKKAKGTPKGYANSNCDNPSSPAYDPRGNLYVEGVVGSQPGNICELPAEGSSLNVVSLTSLKGKPKEINGRGSVMWDGKHIVIASLYKPKSSSSPALRLYETRESSDGNLTVVGHTRLDTPCSFGIIPGQIFLLGDKNTPVNDHEATLAIAGNDYDFGSCYSSSNVGGWPYPSGGMPQWAVSTYYAFGVSVSLPKK